MKIDIKNIRTAASDLAIRTVVTTIYPYHVKFKPFIVVWRLNRVKAPVNEQLSRRQNPVYERFLCTRSYEKCSFTGDCSITGEFTL